MSINLLIVIYSVDLQQSRRLIDSVDSGAALYSTSLHFRFRFVVAVLLRSVAALVALVQESSLAAVRARARPP